MGSHSQQANQISQLALHRPQSSAEWDAWRARRDTARSRLAERARDSEDEAMLLDALGLDPDNEERLVRQLAGQS